MGRRICPKVVFVGQFPPPVTGLTFITSRLASALTQAGYDLLAIDTTSPIGGRSVLFHLFRIAKISRALALIASGALWGGARICYFTAEGGLGLVYSVMIASLARLLRLRIYIHHHSFSYIVQRKLLMGLLIARSGPQAIHVCLSSGMAQDLANCYGRTINSVILSNAGFVQAASEPRLSTRKEIVVGLLSNLTADKGLYKFINILQIAKQRGLPIRGVLGGPIVSQADRAALETAKVELGGYLDYRGPVYDGEKTQFFNDVDVFIFLTTYSNEAQPTVLFEAMAHGLAIISCDRGCIASQIADAGHAFPQGVDAIPETLRVLEDYSCNPDLLMSRRQAALRRFDAERRASWEQAANLFDVKPVEISVPGREVQ